MTATRAIVLPILISAALLAGLAVTAMASRTPADVLGLSPGMSDLEVQRRLERIGEIVRGKERAKQTWKLRDRRYGFLILRYDEDWKIHWATAFAREGGRRVAYREIGDLALAAHTGQHFYSWTVPAGSGAGTWTVTARGGDPRYLDSVSISRAMRQDLIVPPHQAAVSSP